MILTVESCRLTRKLNSVKIVFKYDWYQTVEKGADCLARESLEIKLRRRASDEC